MIMKTSNRLVIEKTGAGGFTLVELGVVIATLAIMVAVLLPALAGTRPNAQAFQCLENQRQLILAWQMYAQDNNDILPPNDYPWKTQESRNGTEKNWVFGSMLVPLDMISTAVLVNPQLSLLALYNTNPAVYKCPADTTVVRNKIRARSVSMNCAVGTRWYMAGLGSPPGTPPPGVRVGDQVGGGWLSGFYADPDPNYRTYGKITQMTKPGPSMTWVIMDENPLTINDACMQMSMAQILVDFPGNYHNGAAGISFADGHTEMHKWTDDFAQTLPPSTIIGQGVTINPVPPSHDLAWIQPRTSAPK
jgi:prepilin-type processing-associated H-X9-DG protein